MNYRHVYHAGNFADVLKHIVLTLVIERMKLKDDEVDACYAHVYEELANECNIQGSVEPMLVMTLAIRALERMADHATNIGKRTSYIVTGKR